MWQKLMLKLYPVNAIHNTVQYYTRNTRTNRHRHQSNRRPLSTIRTACWRSHFRSFSSTATNANATFQFLQFQLSMSQPTAVFARCQLKHLESTSYCCSPYEHGKWLLEWLYSTRSLWKTIQYNAIFIYYCWQTAAQHERRNIKYNKIHKSK